MARFSTKPLNPVQNHPLNQIMGKMITDGYAPAREALLKYRERGGFKKKTPQLIDLEDVREFMRNEAAPEVAALVKVVHELRKGIPDRVVPDVNTIRPPPASVVYGVMAKGAKILDVGVGDAKRIVSYKDLDKEAFDTEPVELKDKSVVINNKWTESERTITSFNAMTQDPDLEQKFNERDGIHLYPNLDKMEEYGVSVKQEDGNYQTKIGKNSYVEVKPKERGAPKGFYEVKQCFKARPMQFKVAHLRKEVANTLHASGVKGVIPDKDIEAVQYKYNGDRGQLSYVGGKGTLHLEDGRQYELETVRDPGIDFILSLEMMAGHAYLVAVEFYKDMFPHPTRQTLKAFAKAHGLKILQGIEIKMPELYSPTKYEEYIDSGYIDGLVYKSGLQDYCVKHAPSFDLDYETYVALNERIRELSIPIQFDEHPGKGIHEFEAEVRGDEGWYMKWARERKGNKKINSVVSCIAMLSWKYVGDIGITEQMTQHIRLEPNEVAPTLEERDALERDIQYEEVDVLDT